MVSKTKSSYGIACCRRNKAGVPEILLIQKANTYAFVIFVLECDVLSDDKIRGLFCAMTRHEKIAIIDGDYDKLWRKVCTTIPDINSVSKNMLTSYPAFIQKKTTFEHKLPRLLRMLKGTTNINTHWDIPKGRRRSRNEQDMDVAIREFNEETTATIAKYNIYMHAKPTVQSYIDGKCKYSNSYFIAESEDKNWCPNLDIFESYTESIAIRWFSIEELRAIEKGNKYHDRLVNIVSCLLKRYKKLSKD